MQVPKAFDFIPMDDQGVSDAVKNALDKADELRRMFRDSITVLKSESTEAKKKLASYQSRIGSAIELIDGRTMSRAKTLLKVDNEFLRRTLPIGPDDMDDAFDNGPKQKYADCIEAMKMIT